jgi:hypothetical protein
MNKKKNPVNKNQWTIQQKYKANVSTSRHNPKKKAANNQQKSVKTLCKEDSWLQNDNQQ